MAPLLAYFVAVTATAMIALPIGATSVAQLQQNIDAYQVSLSPELLAAVDAIHASAPNPGQ